MRKAKIVCTIGPSSSNINIMKDMILSGMNIARINMSHGDYKSHEENILNLRKASKSLKKEIAILMDLQGPKIRVGKIQLNKESAQLTLKTGDFWFLSSNNNDLKKDLNELFHTKIIPTSYKKLFSDVKKGDNVLFDDGLIQAKVVEKIEKKKLVKIEITFGGKLKSNKGINLPDSDVSAPSLTEKDRKDLIFGLSQDIDFIALSFVRNEKDVLKVKKILDKKGLKIPIISKIEKPEAVKNIDSIIQVSDGIMIARGDMAVEMGVHVVPRIQKEIIIKCNKLGKPVITATQMLESMTNNMSPTRAEATDVANAIWDGTDCVMLSGETASGIHPVNVIKTMIRIIEEAEKMPKKHKNIPDPSLSFTANIQLAGTQMAENIQAEAIISVTEKGRSSQLLSSFRPKTKIIAITNNIKTFRKFNIMWGVHGFLINKKELTNINLDKSILNNIKNKFSLNNGSNLVYCRAAGKAKQAKNVNYVKIETL